MPPRTCKPAAAAKQAQEEQSVVLPPYPWRPITTFGPNKRPRTSTATFADGIQSSATVRPRAQYALGQIEESLGVLKEELQAQKQECGKLKSDLSRSRDENIALEEDLRNLGERERLQQLDSTAKINDLSLQLTKQKAKAASELSTAYQEVNDCFGSSQRRGVDVATQTSRVSFVYNRGGRKAVWDD